MKLSTRRATTARHVGPEGTARVDRRLAGALRRARPGDVLVVDHVDLDRAAAEAILDHGVAAVVNASAFVSGRYPALGAEVLARAGVALVDLAGVEVFSAVRDGASVRVEDDALVVRGEVVAGGRRLELDDVQASMEAARAGLTTQLASFTHNTTELLRREEDLLLHGLGFPDLETRFAGRPVVVVVRAFEHEADLRRLRRFIREQRPVLVGVDAGGDVLLEARLTPDLLVVGPAGLGAEPASGRAHGAGQVVSDRALTAAREVLLHADGSDRLVGADRLDRLGVRARRMSSGGTSEDVALLVADHLGGSLFVAVGSHATLDEFLDKERAGMSSSFLTRLRVGPRLVDAVAVEALYTGRVRRWHLLVTLLVGLLAVGAALLTTPVGAEWGQDLLDLVRAAAADLRGWAEGLRT